MRLCACSVMFDSLQSFGLWSTRLLRPWNFPGKHTRMGCYPPPGGSSQPRDWTHVSCIGRQIITESAGKPTCGLEACSFSHSHLTYDFSQNQHMILCFCVQGKIFLNNHHVQLAFFIVLLRYNSLAIQFTYLKCTIQEFPDCPVVTT